MLQTDVEELRTRLEEKNRLLEKKAQGAMSAVQDRNRITNELTELKDHMDIKDRKINVLQRKVSFCCGWMRVDGVRKLKKQRTLSGFFFDGRETIGTRKHWRKGF